MIRKKINLLNLDRFETYQRNGIHYLIVTPTYFFQLMRLGDYTIMTTLLWNIKRMLINKFPNKFNWDNLFFMYNGLPYKTLINITDLFKYSPYVWHPKIVNFKRSNRMRYNVAQIWKKIHHLRVPMLYRRNNWTILEDNYPYVPFIPQNNKVFNRSKRDVMILPNTGKKYHTERNLTDRMVINCINTLPENFETVLLVSKDNYHMDYKKIKSNTNRTVYTAGNKLSLSEIVDLSVQCCHMYIGGDCGFTHLLSNMFNSPDNFVIFYRTRKSPETVHHERFLKLIKDQPNHKKQLVGVDDVNYIDLRALSIYNRNVIFQNNLDGKLFKKGNYYKEQSTK